MPLLITLKDHYWQFQM